MAGPSLLSLTIRSAIAAPSWIGIFGILSEVGNNCKVGEARDRISTAVEGCASVERNIFRQTEIFCCRVRRRQTLDMGDAERAALVAC